jgi:hypothetical protein
MPFVAAADAGPFQEAAAGAAARATGLNFGVERGREQRAVQARNIRET